MSDFVFLRPLWLFVLIPFLLIIWLVWFKQNNQHNWKQVCDPRLLKHLIVGAESKKNNLFVWLLLFYGVVSIISLAGPAWDKLPQPVFRQQSALILLFDLSKSMQAEDVKPSRLVRARLKLLDILKQRREGQTALIVYAGDAFVVSPLTDDTDTIAQLVPSLTPSMMPSQGSRIDLAVSKALQLFKQGGITEGDILLFTDDVPEVYASTVSKMLKNISINLSILSVGTAQGAPINLRKGGFLKDRSGNIVIAKTNNTLLSQLAKENKGHFSKLSVDDSDIHTLINQKIFENSRSEKSDSEQNATIWREQGPWLILLLLPLVLLSFRKGLVFVLVIMLVPVSDPVYALSWNSLWFNSNQQAKQLLKDGKNEESAELFQDSDWQAIANYKAGFYEKAIDLLDGKKSINSTYNRANALAKLKRYKEALKNYDEVIKQDPEHEDALYNKKLIEEELKKQQNKNKNNKDKNNKDKNKKDNKSNNKKDKNQDKNKQDQSENGKQDDQDDQDDQNKKSEQNNSDKKNSESKQQKETKNTENEQNNKTSEKDKDNESTKNENKNDKKQEKNQQQKKLEKQNDIENKEQQQAVEQWLRKIPDDPAGLMRRKFRYQYQQRNNQQNSKGPEW